MPDSDPVCPDAVAAASKVSAGIGPIPTLPIYFKLTGRRALVAGGSPPAVWKVELLVAAGARVALCDAAPCPEMAELARALGGAVEMIPRPWRAEDFSDCAIAVGALDGDEALRFRDAAQRARVPVNIVDVPELCDFQFGTIIARPPLLIGISTDGAAPVFGQALRARIEALLPSTVQAWAQAAKDWRPDLQGRNLGFAARRRFWETFADRALDGSGPGPSEADRAACLQAALASEMAPSGRLVLVGVGPGDPDLVTLGAVRALQSAEVVVHDPGLGQKILGLGRREARRLPELPQDRGTAAMIAELVRTGKAVAWAGFGDPSTSPKWNKRRARLAEAGVPFGSVRGLPEGSG